MIPAQRSDAARRRTRVALAAYLRLLAACLEEEAEIIESDVEGNEDILDTFRRGALMLSLEDPPFNVRGDGEARFRPA